MSDQPQQDPNLPPPYYFEEDTISLIDIMLTLARQVKVIIITPTILCILMIIYVSFIAKPVYSSTTKILSSSGNTNDQVSGIAAQFGFRMPMNKSEQKWVYPDIIKSRTLARAVLKQKFDTNEFGPQKSLLQILTYGNTKPQKDLEILEMDGISIFSSMIEVSEDITTGIITLSTSASNSKLASDIAKVLIDELDKHQQNYNKAKTSKTRKFIQERIIETEKELTSVEEDLKNFVNKNRRIENSPALQLQKDRLAREVLVLTGVFTTLKQQLETIKIEEVKDSDYVIILDHPETPQTRSAPQKKKLVIYSGIFGLLLSLFLIFIKNYYENKLKSDQEKITEIKINLYKNLFSLFPFIKYFGFKK
jgi:uncharacterized protein involved in exopolysaccharide biosynthesis